MYFEIRPKTMNFNVQVLAARDSRGNTALHLAAIGNYIDTALFLV